MRAQPSTHRFGREVLERVWSGVTGSAPTLAELQIAGAVATLETSYGKGWKGAGVGSNNWGAITCKSKAVNGQCPAGCFPSGDSSPGQAIETRCFRVYGSPDEGAADVVKAITLKRPRSWEAMRRGDIDGFSRAMRGITGDPVYYEGTAKTAEERADPALQKENAARRHAEIVESVVGEIASAVGEAVSAFRGGGSVAPSEGGGGSESPVPFLVGSALLGTVLYVAVTGRVPWRR